MQLRNYNRLLSLTVTCFLALLLFTGYYVPPSAPNLQSINGKPSFKFFDDFEGWIDEGFEKYGEFQLNSSLTAEIAVGEGEAFESIQEALGAGYTCIYLKKQVFNVTSPIEPPKENFYILGNGAEIVAVKPMTAVFDIRSVRYAHLDGLFINGNGLAQKCIDASRTPSQVPVHQIRNCKVWGATHANIDFTGCEDSLIFNCWIDGRKVNDTPDAITEYGVKIGEFCDGYRTGGQVNLIHCLMGFHRKADVFAKNVAQLKLANCLLSSKNMWSSEFEAHIIVEGGTGEGSLLPTLELTNCWVENGQGGNVPNILIRKRMMSKLTIIGGMFYTDQSPNVYSLLNPCAETITLVGALFEHNIQFNGYNVVAPTQKLVSVGNTYNWNGIDTANVTTYLIYDRDDAQIETR
ncbi:MAG: hypothetical protein ACPLZC_04600 [Candidatus Bathyarchaeales archaeon]